MNRKLRRAMKDTSDFSNIIDYINKNNIEYAYCKINKNDYDIFIRTSCDDILLYILIINNSEHIRCFMRLSNNENWKDFINNKFSNIITYKEESSKFIYQRGNNVLDIENL